MGNLKTWTFEKVKEMNGGNADKTTLHIQYLVNTKRVLWVRAKRLNEIQALADDFEESELIVH